MIIKLGENHEGRIEALNTKWNLFEKIIKFSWISKMFAGIKRADPRWFI